MKPNRIRSTRASLILLLVFGMMALVTLPVSPVQAQDANKVLVVVNKANSLNSISVGDLSSVFLKEKSSVDGQSLKPINLSLGSPGRTLFDKKVHGMSESKMSDYWQEKKVSGEGTPPPAKGSAAPVFLLMTQSQQAIGYVPASAWNKDQYGSALKVLDLTISTDSGQATVGPDAGNYPLKK